MKFQTSFEFLGHTLEPDRGPLIVAEVGFNHNGDVALAEAMIQSAYDHGADVVKLQTFIGTELYARMFRVNDPDNPAMEIPFHEFWERYQLSPADYKRLFGYARDRGIPLFSTPFDEGSLEMLLDLGMGAIKIASGDLTHHDLLKAAGASGAPVVLSSGMATEEEVGCALQVLNGAGADRVVLLHCVSHYPAEPGEMNLRVLPHLRERFHLPVGLSDHTLDSMSSVVATVLGAVMIEKHFTTDRTLPGADQQVSLDPVGLRELETAIRQTQEILGTAGKGPQASEVDTLKGARRSVVARERIPAGTVLRRDMLSFKRPGTGVPAEAVEALLNRPAVVDIPAETVITWEMVEKAD